MLQRNQYSVGLGVEIPPPKEFVRIYFIQKGLNEEQADYFYLKHELIVGLTAKVIRSGIGRLWHQNGFG
jgi:hypothetical protein